MTHRVAGMLYSALQRKHRGRSTSGFLDFGGTFEMLLQRISMNHCDLQSVWLSLAR